MATANPLRRFAEKANQYPGWLSRRLLTWMFRYKVKLTRTVGLEILHTDLKSVTFRQKNYKKVQNHIGNVLSGVILLTTSGKFQKTHIYQPVKRSLKLMAARQQIMR